MKKEKQTFALCIGHAWINISMKRKDNVCISIVSFNHLLIVYDTSFTLNNMLSALILLWLEYDSSTSAIDDVFFQLNFADFCLTIKTKIVSGAFIKYICFISQWSPTIDRIGGGSLAYTKISEYMYTSQQFDNIIYIKGESTF